MQRLVFEEARTVAGGARQESGVERAQRLAWIVALDEAHRAWEADVIGPPEVARRLREKELDWCRFELDELALASPGAAAEAARQLDEGIDPTRVAAAAGVQFDQPERGAGGRAAGAGADRSPVRWSGMSSARGATTPTYVVARVRERRPPDIGDEPMLARARDELLTEHADEAARREGALA